MDCEAIKQLIQQGLPEATVEITGDDGVHFSATVVSQAFEGVSTLKRHRMVYATLGDKMGGEIHALALRTLSVAESQSAH
ncbi:MAG: BolA family protein [Lysobacterales bacterium]